MHTLEEASSGVSVAEVRNTANRPRVMGTGVVGMDIGDRIARTAVIMAVRAMVFVLLFVFTIGCLRCGIWFSHNLLCCI